jgi:hypothetical protein
MEEVKKDAPAVKEGEENTEKPKVEKAPEVLVPETKEVDKAEQIAKDQRKRAEKAEAQAETLQLEITKLRNEAMSGAKPMAEVNSDLKALATEYNVDETFISKLVQTVRTATKNEIREELEKDYSPKIAKLEQQTQIERMEKRFEDLYTKELKQMSEYEGLVNKEVIKTLAFNPANSKKTIGQIIEDTYGNALQGRKSIESTHASRGTEAPDLVNPTDEDMAKIDADPKLKDEYSKEIQRQVKQVM